MKTAVVLLTILGLGLGAALWHTHRRTQERVRAVETDFYRWSNRWHQSQETLSVTAQNSAQLHTSLLLRDTLLATTSNELARATNRLAEAAAVVAEQQAEIAAASAELTDRDGQVIQLQARRQELERALDTLKTNHAHLQIQYTNASRQLDSLRSQLAEAAAGLKQAKARDQQHAATLAALNLERELMMERGEKLEAAETALRADLATARTQLQSIQKRFLSAEESASPNWLEALTAKFQRLEQAQAKWSAAWNDLAAVRQRAAQLQEAAASGKAGP